MKTIEIRTSQNVVIDYELASLRERVFAFFIDILIFGLLYFLLFLLGLNIFGNELIASGLTFYLFNVLLPLSGFLAYQFFSEALAGGQSWGKRLLGIRVVRLDGREPELSDYLLRAIFHLVDTLTSSGIIAALLISSSANNQRLGDLTAHTTVVRVRQRQRFSLEDILKISTLEEYRPRYPRVAELSEEDMLIVKATLTRYRNYRNRAHRQLVERLSDRLAGLLEIEEVPRNRVDFLKTLIRDYIVLTR
ncbi:MAG: RDD family protein [Saprospiraceae bacterium]|nr:RDD family protein [Saprospiraceae bacterium]